MAKTVQKSVEIDYPLVKKLYGPVLDLGPCVFGDNLTCKALRGFTRLDYLAVISGADVYDKFDNPGGTQRGLNAGRAEEIYNYSVGIENGKPIVGSRALPEVLLNARDRLPIELYDHASGEQITFTDALAKPSGSVIGIKIHLDKLEFPKPDFEPRISRIDGNHRMSGMDNHLVDEQGNLTLSDDEVPTVPFALFLDLSIPEERRIFNVVNSKQQNVEPALLETQRVDLMSDEEKRAPANLPSVIARRLADTGGAFEKMIFAGGDRAGAKKRGLKLALKSSTLASTIKTQLAARKAVSDPLSKDPDELFLYVNNYWKAVRETFPQEWADRDKYILLQTIGLGAFAKYWGEII
ncbi:MAG: DGQHR domain-containing protein [Candidatus Velthaea sp.]